jgi:hypothetical protein
MFIRSARSPRFALGVAAAVILAGTALARTATAFNPQPDPPFGMIGIAQGQTARLNLVNTASPDAALLAPPCRARLRFLDADGNLLTRLAAEVPAGHSRFLDFSPASIPTNTVGDVVLPLRAEIRPAVNFQDDEFAPPCRVTLEIFNNATGRTTVLYAPPCRGEACRAGQ